MKLKDKVIIVTGGARGIGKAIALRMQAEGAQVVIGDIDYEEAAHVATKAWGAAHDLFPVKLDVSKREQVEDTMKRIAAKYGRIDVLVNNAGVTGVTKIFETTDEEWERIMRINLYGTFYCSRAAVKYMMEQRSGKIINVASVAGKTGGGLLGTSPYAASKGGVISLTKGIAREMAPYGILANTIAPGSIDTDITDLYMTAEQRKASIARIPVGRRGNVEDIAGAAIYLASSDSDFMTGATIDINGGTLMD